MVSQLHIGVLTFPFGTHAAPLYTLMQRLAAASAPGTRFSFFNSAVSNSSMDFSDSCENVKVYDVWDGTPEGQVFGGSHFEAVGLFLEASPGNFENAIEKAEEDAGLKISCLITDAFLWFACDLAEKRGIPWVPFWAAATFSLSAHVHTDEILKSLESKDQEQQSSTLSFIPGFSKVRYADLPPEIFFDRNPSPLAKSIYEMVHKLPKSTALVLNCFEEIEPLVTNDLKLKFRNLLNVGPSFLSTPPAAHDGKNGCLSWLENQTRPKSVVYISFGSVITPPENELVALSEALETCKFPFLWSLKDRARKSLPEGFLDRTSEFGKIVPWAPQLSVLSHANVGVFVSHGGYNSFLESVSFNVPMICRPFFGDHKINSRMVEDVLKIGVIIRGGVFTKTATIEALDRVMSSEMGNVIRENGYQMKEKAVNAVKLDGSSSKNFKNLLEIIGAPKSS